MDKVSRLRIAAFFDGDVPQAKKGCWLSLSALNSQSCRAAFLYEAGSGSGVGLRAAR